MPKVKIVINTLCTDMKQEHNTSLLFSDTKDKLNSETKDINEVLSDDSNNLTVIMSHAAVKRMAKAEVKQKFIVGHTYKLAYRKQTEYYKQKEFVLIKYIYAIKNTPVNILVMKEINPAPSTGQVKFTLNYVDCQKFHIKYQPGLEVYSMNLNWIDTIKK